MTDGATTGPWLDRFGRGLRDLRVSVTDRCNFRCRYCMPKEHYGHTFQYVPREQILSFEEITRVVGILQKAGLSKVRITGGEPLLRYEVSHLVRMLKRHPHLEVALTTNGVLLPKHADALKAAGLDRITISLDALDEETFRRTTDSPFAPSDVLKGISAAVQAGYDSVKINCVVKRGLNEDQILPLVEHFRHSGHVLRFIEYMDTGQTNGWSYADVVTSDEILRQIEAVYPLQQLPRALASQTSRDYEHKDGAGTIGMIASVSQPFCRDCTRARLTAKGELYTCLFGQTRLNVREMIRVGQPDASLALALSRAWTERNDHYSETRTASQSCTASRPERPLILASSLRRGPIRAPQEMSYLGG